MEVGRGCPNTGRDRKAGVRSGLWTWKVTLGAGGVLDRCWDAGRC